MTRRTNSTSPQVAAIALYELGGASMVVDTEDVAVRAHSIAPGRFSWRKYPDMINLELVRVALSDARKRESGSLVSGTGRSGWSLTPSGQRWCEKSARLLRNSDLSTSRTDRTAGSIDERRWQRERARVLTSPAWADWQVEGRTTISRNSALDLFRIDRYVIGRGRELKVNRLREMFKDDDEIAPFVEAAATAALREE